MKRILITGCDKGLGYSLASACLDQGWHVLALGGDPAPQLAEHPHCKVSSLNLQQRDTYRDAIATLLQAGQPDLVVLNAGILSANQELHQITLDELDHVFQTNLWEQKFILDILLQQCPSVPRVIAINSRAMVLGHHGWSSSALSKAGLNMLMRLYAVAHPEMHFCAVNPGWLQATAPTSQHQPPQPSPMELAHLLLQQLPQLRQVESGSFVDLLEPVAGAAAEGSSL